MYTKYDVSQINGSEFDSDSVMLYSFPASWTLDGFHTDPNDELSELDKAFARHVSPGRDTGVPEVVELPVIEGATQADIGRTVEEDLFKFTAQTAGRSTIETEGMTDVVMTLYSPAGILVAQDDDSGVARNPRSEERRVGKGCVRPCGSRWAPDHKKN